MSLFFTVQVTLIFMKRIHWRVWSFLAGTVLSQHVDSVFDNIISQLLRPGGLFDDPFGGLSGAMDDFEGFSDDSTRTNSLLLDGTDSGSEQEELMSDKSDAVHRPLSAFMARMKPFSLFDQLALMPDLLLSSLESMPDVVLSDRDCLVTIETRDLDVDSMSVKVFTTGDSIQLEITKVTQQNFINEIPDNTDTTGPGENNNNDGSSSTNSLSRPRTFSSRLRGGGTAMSSMTSMRKFAVS